MHSFVQLLAVGVAITGAFAQYNDGYETVNLPTDPVQIRLAYQGPTAMMVSWNTFEQLTNPSVSYGTNPANLNLIATSSVSITYPTSLTYNNHVNITGLSPYTTYYYLPQYSNATTPYTFTTARAAGDSTPYTVGVVIDMGTFGALGLSSSIPAADDPLGPNEQTTIAGMLEAINNYEFVVHPGDLAYADAWAKEEAAGEIPTGTALAQYTVVYENILNAFFDELEPITSQKAYMVNPGNHEANCDNLGSKACTVGQTNFTGYINHWRMPSNPSGGVGNMWYSYDYGMTHFVHINTETDLGNGLVGPDSVFGGPFGSYLNQQIDWLTNDLASVNRTLTPWVVALGHRPFYVSSSSNICGPCITAFETLFNTYGVDIYVNGHSHLYDRTLPIYNNVIDPNGYNNPSAPMYLTNGAGGHFAGLDTPSAIMPYTVYNQALDYAWTTLEFLNSTHMVVNGLWSANNTVFDSVTLYKAHNVAGTSTSSSTSSSVSATSISSTSTPLSSTSSTPTTTTGTATSSSGGPSYTNFNGLGHLYVYVNGVWMGDIGADDTWYYWPGQGVATWTAYPAAATPGGFTLYKTGYCYIDSTQAFNCSGMLAQAEVFNQNQQGDLLYNGSPAFYASSIASTLNKPTVYATPLPVSMNIIWGNLVATPVSYLSATTTGITTSSSSGSAPSTTGSITGSSSSSASSTSSSSSSSSTTGPITGSSSSSSTSTSSAFSSTSTSSSSSGAASSSTSGSSSTSALSGSSSASSCTAVTVTASASTATVYITQSASTVYVTSSASAPTVTVTVTASASASTITITASASTIISTLDILTTIINTSTVDILTTVVDTSTLDILTTVTAPGSTVISDITLPASTVTSDITLPVSTVTSDITLPASTIETTIISTLDILTTVLDISTLDIQSTVTAPGTTVISTLDILTTIVDISTISSPTTTPSTFQTSSTSSSTQTSATTSAAPIQPPPAKCGKDNCLRGILAKSAVATAFCNQYLMTPSLPTPTYASNCGGLPSRVSSACYCAITA